MVKDPICGMEVDQSKNIYTCPMHPEIIRDKPGDCPKCGMYLEPKIISAEAEEENKEERILSHKFWFGLTL
ncbi:MAG: hypothetical protein NTY47_07730, partial [Candidatus Omnitrophica bacterium]|nr:hypothetical protein [Candidatus Omnitrophota bacterium]